MSTMFKKIFLTCILTLVVLTTGAWQIDHVVLAESQNKSIPETPLYPDLAWTNLGSLSRDIVLNIKGDSITLSGTGYQAAEQFAAGLPQEVLNYYSNEQLAKDGWASYDSFEGSDGGHQIFYHESGVYLAVDFVNCLDAPASTCVTVWMSEQSIPAPTQISEPDQATAVGSFAKTSPAKGATNLNPTSVVLSWGTYSPTPDKYSFCVKEGSGCDENDPNWTGTRTNTSVTLTNLGYNKTYYWQVKAITCATCIPKKFVYADGGWWTFKTKAGSTTTVTIVGNAGVAGAALTYTDSTVKTVTADATGNYSITVPIGWSGTLTPSKTGYVFTPTSVSFNNLTTAQTIQNFIAAPLNTTFSVISGNAGVAGAILNYIDGTAKIARADSMGFYTFNVSPNWSGTVTPVKGSYYFTPATKSYANVFSNQTAQNYTIAVFSDVPSTYWAFNSIERIYAAGIIDACLPTPLSYCPEIVVTRAWMAYLLLRGIHGPAYTPPAVGASTGFSDVPITHWAAAWIKQAAAEGFTGACGAGIYCPEIAVPQDQMAIFLLLAKHGSTYVPPAVGTSTGFNDIPVTYWAAAWIKQLAVEGISTGCGNGNFCPATSVTRAQMATLMVRAFSLP